MEKNGKKNAQYIIASIHLLGPNQLRFVWSRSKKPANYYKNVEFKM